MLGNPQQKYIDRLQKLWKKLSKANIDQSFLIIYKVVGHNSNTALILQSFLWYAANGNIPEWHKDDDNFYWLFFTKDDWEPIWCKINVDEYKTSKKTPEKVHNPIPRQALRMLKEEGLLNHKPITHKGTRGIGVYLRWDTILKRIGDQIDRQLKREAGDKSSDNRKSMQVNNIPIYNYWMILSGMVSKAYANKETRSKLLDSIREMNMWDTTNENLMETITELPLDHQYKGNPHMEPSTLPLNPPKYGKRYPDVWDLSNRMMEISALFQPEEDDQHQQKWTLGIKSNTKMKNYWEEESLDLFEIQYVGASIIQNPSLRKELKSLDKVMKSPSNAVSLCNSLLTWEEFGSKHKFSLCKLIRLELISLGWVEFKLMGPKSIRPRHMLERWMGEFSHWHHMTQLQRVGIFLKLFPEGFRTVRPHLQDKGKLTKKNALDELEELTSDDKDIVDAMYPSLCGKLESELRTI